MKSCGTMLDSAKDIIKIDCSEEEHTETVKETNMSLENCLGMNQAYGTPEIAQFPASDTSNNYQLSARCKHPSKICNPPLTHTNVALPLSASSAVPILFIPL